MRAAWNGAMIAESNDTFVVEGNHCFPAAAPHRAYLLPSDTQTATADGSGPVQPHERR